jgi:protein-S-isoprenylcysteine O-methyltransferase Ste14
MEMFLRVFLPAYWATYIAIAYVLPVRRFKRKYGIDPEAVRNPDPVMQLGEKYRDFIFAAVLLTVAAHMLHPPLLTHLGPLPVIEAPLIQVAGVALLLVALALVRLGQIQLGRSWRIGFDPDGAAEDLIVTGLYRWSRNPIYLGMGLSALAFFLVLPNAMTFAIAMLALVLLQIRVRVEERWLLAAHGEPFRSYCERTPRWLLRRTPLPPLTQPARLPAAPVARR